MEKTIEIRELISKVSEQPLERHGELFGQINQELSMQLQEIESA